MRRGVVATRAATSVDFFTEFKFEFSLFYEFEFSIFIFASSSKAKIYQVPSNLDKKRLS